MLFVPGEVFEVRTRGAGDTGVAWRGWFTVGEHGKFLETVMPISRENKKNVWVGINPRVGKESSVPSVSRVVWVDCDDTTYEVVKESLASMRLPTPTMVVNSGHGVHLYWALTEAVPAEDTRAVCKWLSGNIPEGDKGVYDPTRVMRVPGSANFNGSLTECVILEHNPELRYELSSFQKEENPRVEQFVSKPSYKDTLTSDEYVAIADAWVEGQRHHIALAAAGYMRKKGYSEEDAVHNLLGIHFSRGGVPEDENYFDIIQVCRTTYVKPLTLIEGYRGLERLGVEFPDTPGFSIIAPEKPKQRNIPMGLIDFNLDIREQEFWVDGLVGPGLLTMIAAQAKAGKSMVAMQIGHAIANGYNVYDFKGDGRPHSVLYFQGELSQGMVYQRARAMFPKGTYEDVRKFGMTDKPEKILNIMQNPEPLYDLAEHYEVIIIDPLSVFNANDENSVTSVRETLAVFDNLKAKGKAVILVHHTKKLDSNRDGTTAIPSVSDVRGSSAWFAAVDSLAMLYAWGDTGNARMRFTFRAAPERPILDLYRMEHGGFTHDRNAYLKTLSQRGMPLPAGSMVLN